MTALRPKNTVLPAEATYKTKLNRLGIAFFFDEHGIIDEYMFYLMAASMPFVSRMVFVVNGEIDSDSICRLEDMGCEVLLRPNTGFDVGAYKHGLNHVGFDAVAQFDEVILFNHTFYGPIFPFSEMYEAMEKRACDFWGITSHKEMVPNPFTQEGVLPRHINSHFIAVRKKLTASPEFRRYWETMPEIKTYVDSVLKHESRFTDHFIRSGYVCAVYDDDVDYGTDYPCVMSVDESIRRRCPILKRRTFFHDPVFLEQNAIDLARAVELVRTETDYDLSLIWNNIIRAGNLRNLATNSALMRVLPDQREDHLSRQRIQRIAVCAHVYYTEMVEELLGYTQHIKQAYDFIATTDTEAKAKDIRARLAKHLPEERIIVRVLEVNRGRDMSSLFIACRDLFLDDRYDLVCRLHTKKSPQVGVQRSNLFKRHLMENLLNSDGYVENVLDLFEKSPWVGLAVPPLVHISYPTLGNGWFENKPKTIDVARRLNINVPFDQNTPVGAYGTMFWFVPKALRKLFEYDWRYDDFNPEPHHVDGGLAHILERMIAYCAQDAGYVTMQIASLVQIQQNYTMLEFKHCQLTQHIKWTFPWQIKMLEDWAKSGHQIVKLGDDEEGATHAAFWNDRWLEKPLSERVSADSPSLIEEYKAQLNSWLDQYSALATGTLLKGAQIKMPKAGDVRAICRYIRKMPAYFSVWAGEDLEKAVRRYLAYGWMAGEELLCLFDAPYYMATNPDVVNSGLNPLVHFVLFGSREGRNPHPLFDARYCAHQLAALGRKSSGHALIDYLALDVPEAVKPHPLFDPKYYGEMYKEVPAAGINMLAHFIKYGAAEARNPHPLFDTRFYFDTHPELKKSKINALSHFLVVGAQKGHDPHPLFDVDYYATKYPNLPVNPLVDFVLHGHDGSRQPHPLFDAAFYTRRYKDALTNGLNPLEHYVTKGCYEEFLTGGLFDPRYYLDEYSELRDRGVNPLYHYVCHGARERRKPNAVFDEAFYLGEHPDASRAGLLAFQHFIKYGADRGFDPSRGFKLAEYRDRHPEAAQLGLNPLAHYILSQTDPA